MANLTDLLKSFPGAQCRTLAKNKNTSEMLLAALSAHPDRHIRRLVATNQSTSIEVLKILMRDQEIIVRKGVAISQNVTIDMLDELARDHDIVQAGVASNPNTTSEMFTLLSDSESLSVLMAIGKNPNAPGEILRNLISSNGIVREAVASNPKCPPDILSLLSREQDYEVQQQVFQNERTPIVALLNFMNDEDWRLNNAFLESLIKQNPAYMLYVEMVEKATINDYRDEISLDLEVKSQLTEG
ncbi:MAG: hypothetical protein IBX55_00575 [Methyloprofundus sp.]|nr:hypothetical protein [Methyloprofundus sp.]